MNIALILPTYNAEADLPAFLSALQQQTLQPTTRFAIDSSSRDQTYQILKAHGFLIEQIPKEKFNHGGTRRLATERIDADIYIVMTQDAILAKPDALQQLVSALLSKDDIGCAYARQLPKAKANAMSKHGRYANYPEESYIRYYKDKKQYGIKTCFNSDNLAAYRQSALIAIGGFPKNVITAEDAYVAAKLLQQGYGIHYAANALIYHSHNLSLLQEFHRYFSVGVFHGQEKWIIDDFKSATKEGFRFVKSELRYLWKTQNVHLIPKAVISTIVKFLSYQLGLHEQFIPFHLKKNWGINLSYWLTTVNEHDKTGSNINKTI